LKRNTTVTFALDPSPTVLLSLAESDRGAAEFLLPLIGLVLFGPLIMPGLILFVLASARTAAHFAKRCLHVIADKIVETMLVLLLMTLGSLPALEAVARMLLAFLLH
jgi:hypothetical protein